MRWVLSLFGILVFLYGLGEFLMAKTVMQQIVGGVILCWSGVLIGAAAIVDAISAMATRQKEFFQKMTNISQK